jgi:hypothetical protein
VIIFFVGKEPVEKGGGTIPVTIFMKSTTNIFRIQMALYHSTANVQPI